MHAADVQMCRCADVQIIRRLNFLRLIIYRANTICTSAHLHICTFTYLHICTSAHLHSPPSPMPHITFIIPVYNVPETMLADCLQHLFDMQLPDGSYEVIVIDDGNTHDITAQWPEVWRQRITCLSQPNQGLSVARNTGIAHAHGTYIQFVDADDYLFAPCYKAALNFALAHDADLLAFHMTRQEQPAAWTTPDGPFTGSGYMYIRNMRSAACGYLFKRSLLGNLRFTPGIVHEDVEFTTQLFMMAQRVYDAIATPYYYRLRQDSITTRTDRAATLHNLDTFEQIIYRLQALPHSADTHLGLERRVSTLAMELVYNTLRHTHGTASVNALLTRLATHKLYPFPNNHYTFKYSLFRFLTMHRLTRWVLSHVLK